jgi:protein SCO1/2
MVLSLLKAVCLLHIKKWNVFRYVANGAFCTLTIVQTLFLVSCQEKTNVATTLPFYNSADFTAEWIDKNDARYANIHHIDSFSMKNQLGNTVTNKTLQGKIYVANFFFASCTSICPKMVDNLSVLQDNFANNSEVLLVSFSVTPFEDSVSRLKEYGEAKNINPDKWHLLTGNKKRIYELGRQSYFAEKNLGLDKDSTEFLHTESMLLIDKKGRIRGIYNATEIADVTLITENIETLLQE